MLDGRRLAASVYLPDDGVPHPVVLEALPYRKDDLTASYATEYRRLRDEGGYAVARVDLRGTGSSEGIATDEYPEQEQTDLCEVIAWLARQPWSTGNVGMYGTSYSGFNSIQLAMERPPELKAIVAIYATDDRYTDDVHYEGGVLKAIDLIDYVLYMVAINALPPVPAVFGDGWRDEWARRVDETEPWLLRWLGEQTDGPYWRHGSLRPKYSAIDAATMIVGGWADGYRNATLRMFESLTCPKRMLIGPWAHSSPESSLPGPHIDLVPEMIRWWDRWLKGVPNGIDDEPPITVFVRNSTAPAPDLAEIDGRWRHELDWPPDRLRSRTFGLGDAAGSLEVRGDVGVTAWISCAGRLPWGQPSDQRPDEAFSLVFDWPSLDSELEILGYPRVEVGVRSSAPVAFLSAKLCDVFPDGTSALISRGVLNLCQRESRSEPTPLEVGATYRVAFDLSATSWVLPPGHHLRVDLAGTDWPNVWPPPQPVQLTIDGIASKVIVPVVESGVQLPPPQLHPPSHFIPDDGRVVWRIEQDVLSRETRAVIDHGSNYDLEVGGRATEHYSGFTAVSTEDPGRARAEGRARFVLEWPEATVETEARMVITSDRDRYHLRLALDVSDDSKPVRSRSWDRTYPRRLQ